MTVILRSKRAMKSMSTPSFTKSTDLPCFPVTKNVVLVFLFKIVWSASLLTQFSAVKLVNTLLLFTTYLNLKNSNKIKTEGNEAKLYAT